MANRWLINDVAVIRNPDAFALKYDKVNATYVKMADGTQRRIDVPNLITAADVEFSWKTSDARNKTFTLSLLNKKGLNRVEVGGLLPRRALYMYLDSPEATVTPEVFGDQRVGGGGFRTDIKIGGRTDGPFYHSVAKVPLSPVTQAYITSAFSGPTGTNSLDGLPTWNGNAWNGLLASGSSSVSLSNLGSAQWSPILKVSGPLTSFSMKALYEDVDGTGGGVQFNYTGQNLAVGDYVLLDMQKIRCFLSIAGVTNETFAFNVVAVATNTPFPYFPPLQPGTSSLTFTVANSDGVNTAYDFTNIGTETFRYW